MRLKNEIEVHNHLRDFVYTDTQELNLFSELESRTQQEVITVSGEKINKYTNEFWTSRQRQACSIHEISYRACFKPQLPRFFISRLTDPGDLVYDPFSGRGTTVIEAALLGRNIVANDVNPLSRFLTVPRLFPTKMEDLRVRLESIPQTDDAEADIDLSMFFHPQTLAEIVSIRNYLIERKAGGREDRLDSWIRMVASNRLTGHSKGFFSAYTLPPNQAVSQDSQKKINEKRGQKPDHRDAGKIILKKSRSLMRDLRSHEIENLKSAGEKGLFLTKPAAKTDEIDDDSVQLTVTSPPFLNIVQYSKDNWLRCWFNGLDAEAIGAEITSSRTISDWTSAMEAVIQELYRITKPGGWVAFEVGEVKNKEIPLDEHVAPLGIRVGFKCVGLLINAQEFTKTSNIWGVDNNRRGTNTNRIVLFQK